MQLMFKQTSGDVYSKGKYIKQGGIICAYKLNTPNRYLMSLEQGFEVSGNKWLYNFNVCLSFQLELESMALCGKSF